MSRHDTLYLAWKAPESGDWYTVGCFERPRDEMYVFRYFAEAREAKAEAGFRGVAHFPDFDEVYTSRARFPFLANRLVGADRPDYAAHLERLGFDEEREPGPFEMLARSNGPRATDHFELFAPPNRDDGELSLEFFTRRVHELPESLQTEWRRPEGPKLPLRMESGEAALRLLDARDREVGDVPRYYERFLRDSLESGRDLSLELLRHNAESGFPRYRFLVRVRCTSESSTNVV